MLGSMATGRGTGLSDRREQSEAGREPLRRKTVGEVLHSLKGTQKKPGDGAVGIPQFLTGILSRAVEGVSASSGWGCAGSNRHGSKGFKTKDGPR